VQVTWTIMRSTTYIGGALALLFTACGGAGSETPETSSEQTDLVIGGDENATGASAMYQMPTPNELFVLVRDLAGEGHKRMMNPAANVDRYVTLTSRALNFGVYSTDLVYASYFKLNVEVARYYLTTKKLAEGLDLSSAFNDADFIRLESNLTKGDSLEVISNEAYMKAYEKLQNEKMGPTLSLVLAGGWIESMHLVIRQIEAFGESAPLMVRVAEQKVTLEHLLQLMEPYSTTPELASIHAELVAIRDIYDRVNVKRTPHRSGSVSGRMVLGDEMTIDLTPEKYAELVKAVDALRAKVTRPEDSTNA